MTTLTHGAASRTAVTSPAAVATYGLFFWATAAVFVVMAHRTFDPISPAASFLAKSAVIVLAGFGYMRTAGRRANITHALFVGAAWLLLGIVAEVAVSSWTGHPWFVLLGSPALRFWRDALLVIWIAAPAFFGHHQ